MRKQLYFAEGQNALLKALAAALTAEGTIPPDAKNTPSESAAVRWLIEQEAARRGITTEKE